jgi:hypothetical protein
MIAPEWTAGKGLLARQIGRDRRKNKRQYAAPAAFLIAGITRSLKESYCGPISVKHAPS